MFLKFNAGDKYDIVLESDFEECEVMINGQLIAGIRAKCFAAGNHDVEWTVLSKNLIRDLQDRAVANGSKLTVEAKGDGVKRRYIIHDPESNEL